jgi:hypothetical protein
MCLRSSICEQLECALAAAMCVDIISLSDLAAADPATLADLVAAASGLNRCVRRCYCQWLCIVALLAMLQLQAEVWIG